MDLDALRFGNFAKLGEAVTDWGQMVKKLKTLHDDAKDGLKGKADKANWTGENAAVSRRFIIKTVGEFADAHTQAQSIHRILSDTRNELIHYRTSLNETIEEADKHHVRVTSTSGGSFTVEAKEGEDVSEEKVTHYRNKIQGILKKATTSDSTAAEALKALADQSKYGFTDASYQDRNEAATALREGKRAATYAKHPNQLTPKQYDELARLMKKHGKDTLFAEQFATDLGAKGTLEFWQGINDPDNRELIHARQGQYGDLQKDLSMTLAQATQSDSAPMESWERNLVKAAPHHYGSAPAGSASGFQIMGSLMRYGDYDDKFLNNYGDKLIAEEKRRSDNGKDPAWNPAMTPKLNHTGTDEGVDPMTGYMKALSRSPEAATEFFNEDYVTKDEDSEFEKDGHNLHKSRFQYLFDEREWVQEHGTNGKDTVTGKNYLGHALEAATTGHPAGEDPSAETLTHNKGQAKLYEHIVESVSSKPERVTENPFLSDSLGRISAEYMPDINQAIRPEFSNEPSTLHPTSGEAARFDHRDATRFLHSVAQNPEGYSALNLGQHNYTANMMQYHFANPDLYTSDPNISEHHKKNIAVQAISRDAGEFQGIIAAGRTYEVEQNGIEQDEKFNKHLDDAGTWGKSLAGAGIGMAAGGPAGAVAGGLAGTASDEIIDGITEGNKRDAGDDVIYRNGERWENSKQATYMTVQEGVEKAAKNAKLPSDAFGHTASSWANQGFDNGKESVRDYADKHGIPK